MSVALFGCRGAASRLSLAVVLAISCASAAAARQRPAAAGSRPSTATAISAETGPRVARLVRQLGERDYHRREAAQRELDTLGDQAAEPLLAFLDEPDPEVATRVLAAIPTPQDVRLRVRIAVRLIESARQERVERGVEMLFDDAESGLSLLREALERRGASANLLAAGPPLLAALEQFVQFQHSVGKLNEAYAKQGDPQNRIADSQRNLETQRRDLAFVAVVDSLSAMATRPASAPASKPAPPARP